MNQQEFQKRFNEQMLEVQQALSYDKELPIGFVAWASKALEFVAIWKSGIKPDTFQRMNHKLENPIPIKFSIWEIGTMIQAIRQKGRHDMGLSVDEYCDMHNELQSMSEYIDSVVKPEQERITKGLQREWEVKAELGQQAKQREDKTQYDEKGKPKGKRIELPKKAEA